ncbi:hypothetical protein [Microbaculum marinum]|uniref:Tat pathway signal sequence domain protein n=1 Tax=Microbaculum marinum TaxID=1764581 RepID=A0AAW9RQI6_9HYPH
MTIARPVTRRTDPVSGDSDSLVGLWKSLWRPLSAAGLATAALLLLAGCGPAAATSETVTIELNRLEDVQGGCRLSYVLTNGLPVSVEALALEVVLFDTDGRVDRFLLFKARPLPVAKTRVQQFEIGDTACGAIGRVLLNDVTDCAGEGLSPGSCLAAIRTQSRADVPFVSTLSPDGDTATGEEAGDAAPKAE